MSTYRSILFYSIMIIITASCVVFAGSNKSLLAKIQPPRELDGVKFSEYLNAVGSNLSIKIALEDRVIMRKREKLYEIADIVLTSNIEEGTIAEQLQVIADRYDCFIWRQVGDVLWVISTNVNKNTPLNTRIESINRSGNARSVLINFHAYDNRLPPFYTFNFKSELHASNYHVSIDMKNVTVRETISEVLSQSPNSGLVFSVYEFIPFDVLPSGADHHAAYKNLYAYSFLNPSATTEKDLLGQ